MTLQPMHSPSVSGKHNRFPDTPNCATVIQMKGGNGPQDTAAAPTAHPSDKARMDPERWVEAHCDALFRYAVTRVADVETAKDLVQETFLGAWRSAEQFAGKSSERTWLFRILRNKIADHYRKQRPEFGVENPAELAALEEKQFTQSGFHKGAWTANATPSRWKDASHDMQKAEFWEVVHRCAGKLPAKVASVFLLREVDGQSTDAICSTLEISRNHLGVLLHRARLALRRCLDLNWFGKET